MSLTTLLSHSPQAHAAPAREAPGSEVCLRAASRIVGDCQGKFLQADVAALERDQGVSTDPPAICAGRWTSRKGRSSSTSRGKTAGSPAETATGVPSASTSAGARCSPPGAATCPRRHRAPNHPRGGFRPQAAAAARRRGGNSSTGALRRKLCAGCRGVVIVRALSQRGCPPQPAFGFRLSCRRRRGVGGVGDCSRVRRRKRKRSLPAARVF